MRVGYSILAVLSLVISACASPSMVTADWTSYPRDLVREESQRVSLIPSASLPLDIGTMEAKTKVSGDDAEREGYVLPRTPSEYDEEKLLSRVNVYGRRLCDTDFRAVETHYFYGKEATLKFLRINTPALRVRYRCALSLTIPSSNRRALTLMRISRELPDADFFDISSRKFSISRDNLVEIVRRVAVQEGIPITKEGKDGDSLFVLGGRDPNDLRWGRIEKLAALISSDPQGSELTFRLFAYQLTYHKRGVLGTEQPATPRGAQPWDRRVAHSRADLFLNLIEASVAKSR